MAQIVVPTNSYVQVNTITDTFLFQNIGRDMIMVIFSDTQPADDAPCDFILKKRDGISSNDITGIAWVKSSGTIDGLVGVVEG